MLGQAAAGDLGLSALAECCSPSSPAGWLPATLATTRSFSRRTYPRRSSGSEANPGLFPANRERCLSQQHSSAAVHIAQFCDYLYDAVARWRSVQAATCALVSLALITVRHAILGPIPHGRL